MSDIDDTELSQTSTAGMASLTGQPIDVEKSGSGPNGYLKLAKLMAVMPTMGNVPTFRSFEFSQPLVLSSRLGEARERTPAPDTARRHICRWEQACVQQGLDCSVSHRFAAENRGADAQRVGEIQ